MGAGAGEYGEELGSGGYFQLGERLVEVIGDRFAGDVTQLFCTGDELRVDPAAGLVEILNRDG